MPVERNMFLTDSREILIVTYHRSSYLIGEGAAYKSIVRESATYIQHYGMFCKVFSLKWTPLNSDLALGSRTVLHSCNRTLNYTKVRELMNWESDDILVTDLKAPVYESATFNWLKAIREF